MKKSFFIKVLKGILAGIVISAILVCVLALVIKSVELTESTISAICITIKFLSVLFACIIAVSGCKKKCGAWGAVTAGIFWIICYALLGLFSGFSFNVFTLIDFAATVFAGVLCAIIVKALSR